MRRTAPDCTSAFDATSISPVVELSDGTLGASFSFLRSSAGLLSLCYQFRYQQHVNVPSTAFLLQSGIQATVVAFDDVMPQATALGCSSNLTISGLGFHGFAAASEAPPPTCAFGGLGSTAATVIDDTRLTCRTVAPNAAGPLPLRIELGEYTSAHPAAFPSFVAYDATAHFIGSLQPLGGTYSVESGLAMRGSFAGFGTPRCRFGRLGEGIVRILNGSEATCLKPRFADRYRDAVGSYEVAFAANGQCFGEGPAQLAGFHVYNSQVNQLRMLGAPMAVPTSLDILGEGFVSPALPGAVCRFMPINATLDRSPLTTPLTALDEQLVRCDSPASGHPGQWSVQVLQNGVEATPTLRGEALTFTEFDPSSVRLRELVPPGAPVNGSAVVVTVHGEGFAQFGEGQLLCMSTAGHRAAATLLDSTRLSCVLAPASQPGTMYIAMCVLGVE